MSSHQQVCGSGRLLSRRRATRPQTRLSTVIRQSFKKARKSPLRAITSTRRCVCVCVYIYKCVCVYIYNLAWCQCAGARADGHVDML